jgi:hypothetical protein
MSKFIGFEAVPFEKAQTFTLNKKNRAYNFAHLTKVRAQTLESLELMPPITVNVVTGNITDGQHRHKAFIDLYKTGLIPKKSMLKVMYVNIPADEELRAIVNANTNSKNWTMDNYIASYIKVGIQSYVRLDKWCKDHALTCENGKTKMRYGAAIVTGRRCSGELKKGTFAFTEEELQRAEAVHTEMLEIVEILGLKGRGMWIESLAVSWVKVREQHDFRTWAKQFRLKKSDYMKLAKDNSKEWDAIFAMAHLAIDTKQK